MTYDVLKKKRDFVAEIMEDFIRESEEMKVRAIEYKDKPAVMEHYIAAAQHKVNKASALREAVIAMDEKLERLLKKETDK